MKNIRITNNHCIIINDSKVNTISNGLASYIKRNNLTFDRVIQTTTSHINFLNKNKEIYDDKKK